jgi:hypothetical protein
MSVNFHIFDVILLQNHWDNFKVLGQIFLEGRGFKFIKMENDPFIQKEIIEKE